jgi:hypothetical protein
LTSFEISAGSMSMCTMVAFGAKRLSLPVTRSSKRMPAPTMRSQWLIARFAVTVPCMPGMPSDCASPAG